MEYSFQCPYCAAKISMVLDMSSPGQKYVEDCEVCCRPIEVSFQVEDDQVTDFYATTLDE